VPSAVEDQLLVLPAFWQVISILPGASVGKHEVVRDGATIGFDHYL
jgi:hypothetical protein